MSTLHKNIQNYSTRQEVIFQLSSSAVGGSLSTVENINVASIHSIQA